MNKVDFEEALQKWLDKNSSKNLHASIMTKTAQILDISELYHDADLDISINETTNIITLPESLSSTDNQKFLYQTTDLLIPDACGEISEIKTINYKIITRI